MVLLQSPSVEEGLDVQVALNIVANVLPIMSNSWPKPVHMIPTGPVSPIILIA